VELLPENHFGEMGYMDVTASYTDWLSTRMAYVPMAAESDNQHLTNVAVPIELRRKKLFLKADPELTYDASNSLQAGGLGLSCRVWDRVSLNVNGLLVDTSLVTTDNLTTGYGKTKSDMDYLASYDILRDLTISYNQTNTQASMGEADRYQVSADMHIPRIPFLRVDVGM
jgi:hypothetical protein